MFLLVLHSLKRGALITLFLGGGVLFVYSSYTTGNLRVRRNLFITIIPIIVFFSLALYAVSLSNFFIERFANMDSDGGSGRDVIFQTLLAVWWNETEFMNFVFGNGFAGTIKFVDTFAHNDLLEVMVNYGLLGLIVYLGLWVVIIRVIGKLNFNSHLRYLLVGILLMWIIDSMYHRFFSGLYSAPTVMVLGFAFGQVELSLKRRSITVSSQ
jgi:O-antigen ligase